MFEVMRLMFMYTDTPLHAGTSRGLGAVDLPIQRETSTGYPMVQASSLKGMLRSEVRSKLPELKGKLSEEEFLAMFGPETSSADEFAGALSVGQARILLFPVRSLSGVFAWTTSRDVLARFIKDAGFAGMNLDGLQLPPEVSEDSALVAEGSHLTTGASVVLEDFSFLSSSSAQVSTIGAWLANHALPEGPGHKYWREQLPHKLCILHENAFRDFTQLSTEVQHHNKLNVATKTVDSESGGLWTSESLPSDSLLFAPMLASSSRSNKVTRFTGHKFLQSLEECCPKRIQLGGNETTGEGFISLRFNGEIDGQSKSS